MMKHLKLFESAAPRKVTSEEAAASRKINEICEEYITDIIDDCRSRSIRVASWVKQSQKGYEWTFSIINSYYSVKIDQLCKRMSNEFEIVNWWVESSGTSSSDSETKNKTIITIELIPKFDLNKLA